MIDSGHCDGGSDTPQPYKQFLWGLRYIDAPVLRWRDDDGDGYLEENGIPDEELYYTNDANMNVTALVNTAGHVVERCEYTPYGQRTVLNGDASGDGDNTGNPDTQWYKRYPTPFLSRLRGFSMRNRIVCYMAIVFCTSLIGCTRQERGTGAYACTKFESRFGINLKNKPIQSYYYYIYRRDTLERYMFLCEGRSLVDDIIEDLDLKKCSEFVLGMSNSDPKWWWRASNREISSNDLDMWRDEFRNGRVEVYSDYPVQKVTDPQMMHYTILWWFPQKQICYIEYFTE